MSVRLAGRVVERQLRVASAWWPVYLGRCAEPFIFLFSVGIGVGALVDGVAGPGGEIIEYRTFVAPAMLAGGAMMTAVFASAIDFYSQFKWTKTYDSMLASPIGVRDVMWGELAWVLINVAVQSGLFIIAMVALGLVESWTGVLLLPIALLLAFAFAGLGYIGASLLRSWLDFDYVFLAILPLYFFSASFFPIEQYPALLAWVVRCTPLYHGVNLARDASLGTLGLDSLVSVGYLGVMGVVSFRFATRRLDGLLQP